MYRRNSSGESTAPCGHLVLVVPSHPFRRLSGPWLCGLIRSRATSGRRGLQGPNTIEGFREVKESHQAALWLGGLEAVTDGLRDSKDLVPAET